MAYSYIIKSIEQSDGNFNVGFVFLNNGEVVIGDSTIVRTDALQNVAIDGRTDYINAQVASACKKYMVSQDVKLDISALVGTEVSLEPVKYETKAEIAEKFVTVPFDESSEILP